MRKLFKLMGQWIATIGTRNKGQVFGPNYVNMCAECNEWVEYGPLTPCGRGRK